VTSGEHTSAAVDAVLAAVEREPDFGGWLAGVLAVAAAQVGGSGALTAGRPGSREADHVRGLVKGTVRWHDECLADYRRPS
jgi:hypothetical protein